MSTVAPLPAGTIDHDSSKHFDTIFGRMFLRRHATHSSDIANECETIALGAEYSLLPGLTVSGVDISFWAIAADLRIFPLANGFFVGARVGHQHFGGQGTLTVASYGSVHEALMASDAPEHACR